MFVSPYYRLKLFSIHELLNVVGLCYWEQTENENSDGFKASLISRAATTLFIIDSRHLWLFHTKFYISLWGAFTDIIMNTVQIHNLNLSQLKYPFSFKVGLFSNFYPPLTFHNSYQQGRVRTNILWGTSI